MKINANPSTRSVIDKNLANITKMMDARDKLTGYSEMNTSIGSKEEKEILEVYKNIGIHKETLLQDTKELEENPYHKNIKLKEIKHKNISYHNLKFKARNAIEVSYVKFHGENLESHIDIGYFDSTVNFPILKENGKVWMSSTLAEQRSMKEDIQKAKGNVLTFGLGIGYYAYMCLIKEEVESVTVVEFNPDVIELFKKYILPQFPKEKNLQIIQGDMYQYYNEEFLSQFDYIFVDVWKDNLDGLNHYRKLMATGIRKDNIGFWIEDTIIEPVKMLMTVYFDSLTKGTLTQTMHSFDSDNFMDFKRIHKYFRKIDKTVTDGVDLIKYINDIEVIRDIAGL